MAGSKQTAATPIPTELTVRKQSKVLEIAFDDGAAFTLPFELLRVYSPSAEVRGHGPGQEVLQTGKRDVELTTLEQVGNYAVQPHFSDGHNTGIYTWDYLYWLGSSQPALWAEYLKRLEAAGYSADAGRTTPMTAASEGSACGHKH
ncbi:MAG: gamma-butyrobetaine hydroxylase-like domain-containing protein [Burkholderiaceae bacterium]